MRKLIRQFEEARWGWAHWAAIACILLLVSAATVQVAHAHPLTKAPEHCQICLSFHSALPAQVATAQVYTAVCVFDSRWYSEDVPARFVAFSLSNRPPPLPLA
ncbi:MAG TPA: hypothetical protein VM554_07770 [Acidisarcina sp.]|nr:hypothetical protein [Acidisarcina sp.]